MTPQQTLLAPESSYPAKYREAEANDVLTYLNQHQSLTIVGMKRVGVSNFLKFITYNKTIRSKLSQDRSSIFVYLDANDLIDITLDHFWLLLLKRMYDAAVTLPAEQHEQVEAIYHKLTSKSKPEAFFLLEGVKEMAAVFAASSYYPVIILARFDRLLPIFSEQFFANLQSVVDTAREHITYVFTSYLPLATLCPQIFFSASFSMFSRTYYLKPATGKDLDMIIATMNSSSSHVSENIGTDVIALAGGHVQLLRLCLIVMSEQQTSAKTDHATLLLTLMSDERILLQCEEIFESLTEKEQKYLLLADRTVDKPTQYLLDTGLVLDEDKGTIFSPIFAAYLNEKRRNNNINTGPFNQLTKKETLLLNYMVNHKGEVCSRDDMIYAVWPEFEDISDWALDQLVSRLRKKLEAYNVPLKIKTNRGKGYELWDAE